jgi:predicted translin family RNA/ssDNA-binding protein
MYKRRPSGRPLNRISVGQRFPRPAEAEISIFASVLGYRGQFNSRMTRICTLGVQRNDFSEAPVQYRVLSTLHTHLNPLAYYSATVQYVLYLFTEHSLVLNLSTR